MKETVEGITDKKVSIPNNEEYNAELKNRYEDEYGAKLINSDELEVLDHKLYGWLSKLTKYGRIDKTMLILYKESENTFNIKFWTTNYQYNICAIPSRPNKMSYLGCTMNSRISRVGENWFRGSDLADGQFSEETFNKISYDIVSCEIKHLELWR